MTMATSATDISFLLLCEEIKEASHDPHRQVGAVIVGEDGTIIATGSNSPPEALGLTRSESHAAIEHDPKWKYFMLEHAERNAINAARDQGLSLAGATAYGTLFPCADCARALVAAGVRRLVVSTADQNRQRDEKWSDHYSYSHAILTRGNIQVELINSQRRAEAS
jgi:dCMP deaminase